MFTSTLLESFTNQKSNNISIKKISSFILITILCNQAEVINPPSACPAGSKRERVTRTSDTAIRPVIVEPRDYSVSDFICMTKLNSGESVFWLYCCNFSNALGHWKILYASV